MYLVGLTPLKELISRLTMQIVILTMVHMDNEINGVCNKYRVAENQKFLDFEIEDFVSGFERRLVLLTSNAFILNCPKDLLDGSLLKKLVKTGTFIFMVKIRFIIMIRIYTQI